MQLGGSEPPCQIRWPLPISNAFGCKAIRPCRTRFANPYASHSRTRPANPSRASRAHPHLNSLHVLTRAQRTRVHLCPKHRLLCHLGLYKFEFEFNAPRKLSTYVADMAVQPEEGGKLAHGQVQSALPILAKDRSQATTPDGNPRLLYQSSPGRRQRPFSFTGIFSLKHIYEEKPTMRRAPRCTGDEHGAPL